MKTALVLGASGLVGGHLLRQCLATEYYTKVAAVVRRPLETVHQKLEQHFINFDELHKYAHLIKADDVFCTVGTTIRKAGSQETFEKIDFLYPLNIAELASANGAQQLLLVTSMGANKDSSIFYNRVKGKLENAVTSLPFQAVQIFRPSLLLGERKEKRPGESAGIVVARMLSPLLVGGLRKYRGIEAHVVAAAMVHVATNAEPGIHIYESDSIQNMYDEQVKQ